MSDPVKNVEIEDVLSSIRRLVSEDARPRAVAPRPAPDKLVLTPSQRVAEPDDSAAASAAVADSVDTFHFTAKAGAPGPLTLSLADAADPDTVVSTSDATQDASADDEPAAAPQTAQSLSRLVEHEVEQALRAFPVPDTGAEPAQDTAADDSDTDVTETDVAETDVAETDTTEADEEPQGAAQPDPVIPHTPAPTPPRPAPTLEQKVAELEAMIAQSDEEWEAEAPEQGDNAAFLIDTGEALSWQDYSADEDAESGTDIHTDEDVAEPEPQIAYFRRPRPADSPAAPPPSFDAIAAEEDAAEDDEDEDNLIADDAPLIDEDMLRDMVADIVRQELQGALGERITRNVRKLVRREIQRALLAQQLD